MVKFREGSNLSVQTYNGSQVLDTYKNIPINGRLLTGKRAQHLIEQIRKGSHITISINEGTSWYRFTIPGVGFTKEYSKHWVLPEPEHTSAPSFNYPIELIGFSKRCRYTRDPSDMRIQEVVFDETTTTVVKGYKSGYFIVVNPYVNSGETIYVYEKDMLESLK